MISSICSCPSVSSSAAPDPPDDPTLHSRALLAGTSAKELARVERCVRALGCEVYTKEPSPNITFCTPSLLPSVNTFPNLDPVKERPPHLRGVWYSHGAVAAKQRWQKGFCSSHFCRRVRHRTQPPQERVEGSRDVLIPVDGVQSLAHPVLDFDGRRSSKTFL